MGDASLDRNGLVR